MGEETVCSVQTNAAANATEATSAAIVSGAPNPVLLPVAEPEDQRRDRGGHPQRAAFVIGPPGFGRSA
jgi:hypothetical protein